MKISTFSWGVSTILLCSFIAVSRPSVIPSGKVAEHTGREYLDSNGKYLLSWRIDDAEETIYFEVTAETKGYVGFGISPNGGMNGADILIAGVTPEGIVYDKDYHGVGNTAPVEDDHSDWIVTAATETENHTTLHFHRLLSTCDEPNDIRITDGTMRLIWSLGETDEITYHLTNRGTKSVNFYLPDEEEFEPEQYQKLDLLVNQEMLPQHTSYWCSIHRAPVFTEKQHLVAFEAVLESEPALQHTHHFIIYRCLAPNGLDPDEIFEPWVDHPGDHCYGATNSSFPFLQYCSRYSVYIWSKGGRRLVFPPNMGLPVPDVLGRREYYGLEIHYDNPEEIEGLRFETGARMYYTPNIRETDVGLLLMNHDVVPQLTVPPQTQNYIVAGHCSSQCTDRFLPDDGITIFNNLFHAHLAGRGLKLRHFRGGEELPWVDVDKYYDFDFQQNKPLSNPRKLLRGDQLTVECTYDSMNAVDKRAVVGGLSSFEEMCEAIVYYYPRQGFMYCGSAQDMDQHFNMLGMTNYTQVESETPGMNNGYVVLEPEHLAGPYIESVSFKVDWTPAFRERFQQEKRYGEHRSWCSDGEEGFEPTIPVKYPDDFEEYVPPNDCLPK